MDEKKLYCFICSEPATTDEHIFPKWLQNKFNLWDEFIVLPNGTKIPYRQLKIPCCSNCNSNLLSPIEDRIKNGNPSNEDIWKWGLKIHYGLNSKHDFLEWDRANPGYKIGQIIKMDDPLEIDRHLVHTITGKFTTAPSPFGSVFKFTFPSDLEYNFIHLLPIASVCISLGNIGYVIFIKDVDTLTRQPEIIEMYKEHHKKPTVGTMLNFFVNSYFHLLRHETSHSIVMSDNFISSGRPQLISKREITKEEHEAMWKYINQSDKTDIINHDEYRKRYLT